MRQTITKQLARLTLMLGLGLGALGPAWGATIGGVTLPDTYTAAGQVLVLNGLGIRTLTIFNVKVYVAALYVAQRSADAHAIMASAGPKVILLRFMHAASKSDIEKRYREGESKNCSNGECAASDAADFERLIASTPAAAVGDTLTFAITPRGVRAMMNDQLIGEFANPDLALRLLAGFIGESPPSEDLKRQLLGAH